jgi:hypothetical protein
MIGRSYPRQTSQGYFSSTMCAVLSYSKVHQIGAQASANQTVPYGTAPLGGHCPRHFVPGYDHTVPPGQAIAYRTRRERTGKKTNSATLIT